MPTRLTGYETLAVVTAVATLALIAVGALVRTTGSGLGCPDWPLCQGGLIPPMEREAIIEYLHRTLASVVGLLIVTTAAFTWRLRRDDRPLVTLALVSLPLLALQAWLGKVTVERELPAEVVAIHLSTALILFAVVSLIAAFVVQGPARRRIESVERASLQRVAMIAATVTAVVMVIGAYVVGTDAGFACTGWPGCPEAQAPFVNGERLQHIHWLHRFTVLGGLLAIGFLGLVASNQRTPSLMLQRAVYAVLALYGAQIVIGGLNIWSDFSDAARVGHLAVGSAIWALLVVIVVAGRYERVASDEVATRAAAETSGTGA
ncbi:MAG TPA: COX15/CtaA family protein [Dehalococcoidia bacterium]|nr:COX15/CtaA family protein [Dehalococcoidia bacterium]